MWLIYDFLVINIGYMIYQCISIFSRWNINFIITSTLLNQLFGINWFPLFSQTMFLKWMQFGIHIYNFLLKYMLGLLLILISKSWGCPPLGARHAFPTQRHMRRGGVIYFCQGFFPCMMQFMDGWMDGSRDEKSFTKNNHDVLSYM
jgi:hypothetical protein